MKEDIICKSGKGQYWTESLWMAVIEEQKMTGKIVPVMRVKEIWAEMQLDT